jgi:DNA ligase 1
MSTVNCPQIKLLNHLICESREDMEKYMDKITNANGEGVMLRTPDSLYEQCRSKTLLKVKKFEDAEATVISYEPGTGRLTGLMGAMRVRDRFGIEFKIGGGFSDEQRGNPPAIGARVTFKFMGR